LPESGELIEQARNDTYAELWVGDHPNAPAEIIIDPHEEQLKHIIGD
jgi:mannose-6-phosphate isomerase class I